MRILGIDPGYAIVGCAVIDYENTRFRVVDARAVTTEPSTALEGRILSIYQDLCLLLDRFRPDAMAIEQLFFTTNQKTVIWVAQARGVVLLAAAQRGVPIYEYPPLQVNSSVTGYGKAEKRQVMEMTRRMLGLEALPKPDDVADAMAVAICHGHSAGSGLSAGGRHTGAKAEKGRTPGFSAAVLARNPGLAAQLSGFDKKRPGRKDG